MSDEEILPEEPEEELEPEDFGDGGEDLEDE